MRGCISTTIQAVKIHQRWNSTMLCIFSLHTETSLSNSWTIMRHKQWPWCENILVGKVVAAAIFIVQRRDQGHQTRRDRPLDSCRETWICAAQRRRKDPWRYSECIKSVCGCVGGNRQEIEKSLPRWLIRRTCVVFHLALKSDQNKVQCEINSLRLSTIFLPDVTLQCLNFLFSLD